MNHQREEEPPVSIVPVATTHNGDPLCEFEGHLGMWNIEHDEFHPITFGPSDGLIRRIRREANAAPEPFPNGVFGRLHGRAEQ